MLAGLRRPPFIRPPDAADHRPGVLPRRYTGCDVFGELEEAAMTVITDATEYRLQLAARATEQLLAHAAAPYTVPLYVPADADGLETEAYTAAGPEEEN
jgi:hypothetical protein